MIRRQGIFILYNSIVLPRHLKSSDLLSFELLNNSARISGNLIIDLAGSRLRKWRGKQQTVQS